MRNHKHLIVLIPVLLYATLYFFVRDRSHPKLPADTPVFFTEDNAPLTAPPEPEFTEEMEKIQAVAVEIFEGYIGIPEPVPEPPSSANPAEYQLPGLHTTNLTDLPEWTPRQKIWTPTQTNLGFLRKFEGSYSTDELLNDDRDRSLFLPIDSGWFFEHPNAPQLGMQFWKNPETDQYEAIGGRIIFPSGLGFIHEENKETGEKQTFLQFQKKF